MFVTILDCTKVVCLPQLNDYILTLWMNVLVCIHILCTFFGLVCVCVYVPWAQLSTYCTKGWRPRHWAVDRHWR